MASRLKHNLSLFFGVLVVCLVVMNQVNYARGYYVFNQSLIDRAMNNTLPSFQGAQGREPVLVGATQALYYLTLVASVRPASTSSNLTFVKDQVLLIFRNLVSGGKEPHCSYPLNGWSEGAVALSLVLIKHTPSMWEFLTPEEREKSDWLMKALAITGNWIFNDANNFSIGLGDDTKIFKKDFNPNYIQGYMAIMIGFSLYFGPENADQILTNFDYDAYMKQFALFGWTNILVSWSITGRSLMENGGLDDEGGFGVGAKIPFKWNGYGLDDINGIFYSNSVAGGPRPMYYHIVTNSVGPAHILSGSSPVLGELGMCYEFNTIDSAGLRSDALYSFEGWMNNLITRATMLKLGVWGGKNVTTVEKQMYIGTMDLIYKLHMGYEGINIRGSFIHDDSPDGKAAGKGYYLHLDIWYNFVGKSMLLRKQR